MTIENYCLVADLTNRLIAEDATASSIDEAVMDQAISAASRMIEQYCGRRFYKATETRYYTPIFSDELFIHDLISVTTLKTDEDGDRTYEITWAATDYDLMPLNAALDNQPYTTIQITPDGVNSFPAGLPKSVQIVGVFGYASKIPEAIREACALQATRFFKRRDAPFGVIGSPDLGELRNLKELDPDVKALLDLYRRVV